MKKIIVFIYFVLCVSLRAGHAQEHILVEDPATHQHELELQKQYEKQQEELKMRQLEELRKQEQAALEHERELAKKRAAEQAESENDLNECIKEVVLRRLTGVNSPEKNEEIQALITKLIQAEQVLAQYESVKFGALYQSMTDEQINAKRVQAVQAQVESPNYDSHYAELIKQSQTLNDELHDAQTTPDLFENIIDDCLSSPARP